MITRIYLDLDDVLNYLAPYVLNCVGCPIGATDYNSYPGDEVGYDIVAAANMMHPTKEFTKEEFWGAITRKIWAAAPRSEEYSDILRLCFDSVGERNIHILTRATDNADCYSGKKDWMDRNVPGGMRRQHLIVGEDCKELLARPDTLLIDDNEKNISAFRKSGGMAITVPRPWNRLRGCANTSLYLKGMFEIIFGRRAA